MNHSRSNCVIKMSTGINCREILQNSCREIADWSPLSRNPLKFVPVDLQSETGRKINALFTSRCYSLEIIAVDRIENPYLMLAYSLKKQELRLNAKPPKEYWLFHGTTSENAVKIARDNFDWRLCAGHLYGEGVSFSNNAWYASYYSDGSPLREMLLARVIVTRTTVGSNYMRVPPDGYDASSRIDGKVTVKYDDDTFYPAFRIKYCDKVQAKFFKIGGLNNPIRSEVDGQVGEGNDTSSNYNDHGSKVNDNEFNDETSRNSEVSKVDDNLKKVGLKHDLCLVKESDTKNICENRQEDESSEARLQCEDDNLKKVELSVDLSIVKKIKSDTNSEDNFKIISDTFYRLKIVQSYKEQNEGDNSLDLDNSEDNLDNNLKQLRLKDELGCWKEVKDNSESEDNLLYNLKRFGLNDNVNIQKSERSYVRDGSEDSADTSEDKSVDKLCVDVNKMSVRNRVHLERHYADENYNYESRTFSYNDYGYDERFVLGFYPDTDGYARQFEYEDDFVFDDEFHEEYFYRRWFGDANSEDDLF